MAALPSRLHICFSLFFLLSCTALISMVSALEFHVGGERGWIKPTGNGTETYNQWAKRNRFHIGDSVYFKYKNDSVLLVDHDDYALCNTANPVLKFEDGNTTFTFNRHGLFYFISGKQEHCKSGQKLIIRVMVHPANMGPVLAPAPAPAPGPSGSNGSGSDGDSPSGTPMPNSALMIKTAASLAMVELGIFFIFSSFI